MSFQIEMKTTRLTSLNNAITGVDGSLDAKAIQILKLEPGGYIIQTHALLNTSLSVEVTAQGLVEYRFGLNVTQSCFFTAPAQRSCRLIVGEGTNRVRRSSPYVQVAGRDSCSGGLP